MPPLPSPLADLRVLDLAGPIGWYATRLLADLGADVIRIEPPGGDPARRLPPYAEDGEDTGLSFKWFNLGKRSHILDLETEAGREAYRALANDADLIVESFQPGWLAERGIGYEQLAASNPRLIQTSVTPFGQFGPKAQWQGADIVGLATGGLLHVSGCPWHPPSGLGGEQGYLHCGAVSLVATLIALFERSSSGAGQQVDVSLQDTLVFTNENALGIADLMGHTRARIGAKFFAGDSLFFKALDGWIVARLGRRWDDFLAMLDGQGYPTEQFRTPEWQDLRYRDDHSQLTGAAIAEVVGRNTRGNFTETAQKHRLVAALVANAEDLYEDNQLMARDFWVDVDWPNGVYQNPLRLQGAPFKLSKTPWRITGIAPERGQHNGQGWRSRPEEPPRQPALEPRPTGMPLAGLRVLDFSWVIAGPAATQVLADHGADVLKIETAVHPDSLRVQPLPRPAWHYGVNQSGIFNLMNTSKRSVTLDLRTEGGQQYMRDLLRVADVVVDNYGVDPYPKWGLTLEEIRRINPDVIVARSSVMGRTGPLTRFVGLGYTIGPMAGLNNMTGFPGDPPVGSCTAHPDYSSNPQHLLIAMLTALHYRNRTGLGQEIDLSQHESTVVFNGPGIADFGLTGRTAKPSANRHPAMAPHGVYPARGEDRWVAIACQSDEVWRRLAAVIGRPELADDSRFATFAAGKANEDALDPIIVGWTQLRAPLEAAEALQAAGVAAGPVQHGRDLLSDPHLKMRRRFARTNHPEIGWTTLNGPSFKLSRTPGALRRHPPLLGQDTEDVLRELVGLDEEGIAMAYVDNVIQ